MIGELGHWYMLRRMVFLLGAFVIGLLRQLRRLFFGEVVLGWILLGGGRVFQAKGVRAPCYAIVALVVFCLAHLFVL